MDEKVDIVITYVDSNDKNWKAEYNKFVSQDKQIKINGIHRYTPNNNLLKYLFRGIDRYMYSWIGKVFLVVSSKSQVPSWVNTSEVNVVEHKDFIPQQYLPTFNSCTIECFLYRIPNLSENFIYSNDDTYVINYTKKNMFFDGDKIVFNEDREKFTKNKPKWYPRHEFNYSAVYKKGFSDNTSITPYHIMSPHKISIWKKIHEMVDIDKGISRFRQSNNNYNQFLNYYYARCNGLLKFGDIKQKYIQNTPPNKKNIILELNKNINDRLSFLCINDCNNTDFKDNYIDKLFDKIFPYKSKYEKGYIDYKFMSIGSNCANIAFLENKRIKGPIDNIVSKRGMLSLKSLLNGEAKKEILSDEFQIIDWYKNAPTDLGLKFIYENFDITHNDPRLEKYKQVFSERYDTFLDFYENINDKDKYFVYSLGFYDYNKSTKVIYPKFHTGLKYLSTLPFKDKIIIVTTKNVKLKNSWNFHNSTITNEIKKYGFKHIEIIDNNLDNPQMMDGQFMKKFMAIINETEKKKIEKFETKTNKNSNNTIVKIKKPILKKEKKNTIAKECLVSYFYVGV